MARLMSHNARRGAHRGIRILSAAMAIALALAGCNQSLGVKEEVAQKTAASRTPTAMPTFNPASGSYSSDQSVIIKDADEGAAIYYTIDGSDPTAASKQYSAPISVAGNGTTMTIKALATKAGIPNSTIASASYTIDYSKVSIPNFSPAAGSYSSDQSVIISSATEGAMIYYTTDGSEPTTGSTKYASPIKVVGPSAVTMIKAIAAKAGMANSQTATVSYSITYAYTLNLTSGAGGSLLSSATRTVDHGVATTISAKPNTGGYLFSGWVVKAGTAVIADSGAATTTATLTSGDASIQANFTPPALRSWEGITSDSTGQYLAAVVSGGQIYTSQDYGATWTLQRNSITANWYSIASDKTGQYLAASAYAGQIYTSDNYGVTWTARAASRNWYHIASDGTGKYLAAVVTGGTIYTSTDYGANWTTRGTGNGLPASASWSCVDSDYTGQYLIACSTTNAGKVYISSDYGATWAARENSGNSSGIDYTTAEFVSCAIGKTVEYNSGVGAYTPFLAAAISNGYIISFKKMSDHEWWTEYQTTKYWQGIAASSTGTPFVAGAVSDTVYIGSGGGLSAASGGLPLATYSCVSSDNSGTYLATGVLGGHLYTSTDGGASWKQSL